ncbi:uncharacterized protein LOC119389293 [Rhipicephalus sanguineus]|uniref:uncharacterized protein LOC119389293 n=1 Tax=Rhipicephalus sanguineus TaxID=34632 RepID=UPI001894DB5B|nr:uncharacterized protein LOC119389293 [Rhipicephalus sanguineus]
MATYTARHEPLVTCPFNPAHQVKSGRYQIHITKCKKSHPGIDIYRCPFSPDHVVEPSKLMHHVYTCPLNSTVKRYLSKPDKDVMEPRVATIRAAPDIKPEEDWEEEANEPQAPKGKAVRPIFTDVQAMAPAQRRKFYASLREKANESASGDAEPSSPETVTNDKPGVGIPERPSVQPQDPWGKAPPAPVMLQGEVVMCHSDGSEGEDGEHRVYYMGARRGNSMMASDLEESDDEVEREVQARMKLLGIGRGRRLN